MTVYEIAPGELMRLVADGFTHNGIKASLPDARDRRRLSIACPQAQCFLSVEDRGSVMWDWRPAAGARWTPSWSLIWPARC